LSNLTNRRYVYNYTNLVSNTTAMFKGMDAFFLTVHLLEAPVFEMFNGDDLTMVRQGELASSGHLIEKRRGPGPLKRVLLWR